jgi:hypothetical protein
MKATTALLWAIGAVSVTVHLACSDDESPEAQLTELSVAPSPLTVEVGITEALVVEGTFDDGNSRPITTGLTFVSADESVATVDTSGSVTGVSDGFTTVTVSIGDLTAMARINVRDPTPRTIPMTVDDHFRDRAGFSEGGPPLHTEDEMCPERAGGESGVCHRFTWDGSGGTFTGAFWIRRSDPEIMNPFDDVTPVPVAAGATGVTFWAWSENGGEVVRFGAGLDNDDEGTSSVDFTLTDTPTQYTVSLTPVGPYTEVSAGFLVALDNVRNPTGATFFVDDIQWTSGVPPTPIPLPMTVDEQFVGRAAFGPEGPPLHTEDDQCTERAGGANGVCHRFTWDGSGGTFSGGFWIRQSDLDIMNPFEDINPVPVEPGATGVTFWAWGETGGEIIRFGAGLGDESLGEEGSTRNFFTLTNVPTQYTVSLAPYGAYTEVSGAFAVVIDTARNPDGATFFVDDIQWTNDVPPTSASLPMTVDTNFPGRAEFSESGGPLHTEDDMCPVRAGEANGACHRFMWNGMGGAFTGGTWIDGASFSDLDARPVDAGATDISFWAWGEAGGEVIEFGAGLRDAGLGEEAFVREFITLTTTPTRYSVPLADFGPPAEVRGAFVVAIGQGDNPTGATFYVDDIQWIND